MLLIVVAVVIIGGLLARNIIATNLIEKGAKNLVGLKLTIGNIDLGILKTNMKVDDLDVYNPSGYTEKYIAELPLIFVNYALLDIIKGFIHLPELEINLQQVNVEKDKNGVLNLDHIQTKSIPAPKKKKTDKKKGEFLIDRMTLKIGTIHYIDNSQSPPIRKKIDLKFSKTFTNLSDPKVIVSSIVKEIVGQLVSQGVAITVKSFLNDKEFMKSLIEGDSKGMKEAAAKNVKGLGRELEDEIFANNIDNKSTSDQKPKLKSGKQDQSKNDLEGLLEDAISGKQ